MRMLTVLALLTVLAAVVHSAVTPRPHYFRTEDGKLFTVFPDGSHRVTLPAGAPPEKPADLFPDVPRGWPV